MVVCELADYAALYPGNFIRTLSSLESAMKQKGDTLIYVLPAECETKDWVKKMQEGGSLLYFYTGNVFKDFLLFCHIVKAEKVDVIHTHFFPTQLIPSLYLLRRFCKTRIICHFHNLYGGKKSWKQKICNLLYGNTYDLFCGCGKAVYEDLLGAGLAKEKCSYITNAISFERLDNGSGRILKDELGISGSNVLLIFGTHFYRKGVDIAIKAIDKIAATSKIVLIIVCSNKEFVEGEIIRILGCCPSWIRIMPPNDDVAFYYKGADVFLSPSRSEGLTYALIEAVYCETMVIRSNIDTQEWGLPMEEVCKMGDVSSLQKSIEKVLALDIEERKFIVAEQKRHVVTTCDLNLWVQDVEKMYVEACKR